MQKIEFHLQVFSNINNRIKFFFRNNKIKICSLFQLDFIEVRLDEN